MEDHRKDCVEVRQVSKARPGVPGEEERNRMQLSEHVGQQIIINAQPLGGLQQVKLLGVEAGGVWIESQEITNQFLVHFKIATAPNTFVFFLPYGQIEMIAYPSRLWD
jgi:hypothetical protein